MNTAKTEARDKPSARFQGIEEDAELETKANVKLAQLMTYAPPGAVVNASVRKDGNGYLATIVVSSAFRTFYANAYGLYLHAAVNRALSKMDDQLYNWRFGRGGGQPARRTGFDDLNHSPMAG